MQCCTRGSIIYTARRVPMTSVLARSSWSTSRVFDLYLPSVCQQDRLGIVCERMGPKRTLDSFFSASPHKKRHAEEVNSPVVEATAEQPQESALPPCNHSTYPFPVPQLPSHITSALLSVPAVEGKILNDQPDLDLLYFKPYIPKDIERDFFEFLRQELFFYRVQYKIKRGPTETQINTPRL